MLIPITTARDILIFQQNSHFLTMAADTLGAIGAKPADCFSVPPEVCGRLTARVCLQETLAVGAAPVALMALICNERDPTGTRLLTGVRAELADAGYAGIPVGGSSEDNMATTMTALGITLLGECTTLAWRQARPGDGIYLVGRPYVGQEVLTHLAELLTPVRTQQLRTLPEVGDVLPCGSRGAAWELQVLTRETGLTIHVQPDINPELLSRSAGPATCAIVTAHEPFILEGISVERLGTVGDLLDLPSNP